MLLRHPARQVRARRRRPSRRAVLVVVVAAALAVVTATPVEREKPGVPPGPSVGSWGWQARGTEPNYQLDSQLAQISHVMYEDPPVDGLPAGWRALAIAEREALGIVENVDNVATGFYAAVFVDGSGHCVVGYRGADGGTLAQDQQTVVAQEFGIVTWQYDSAVKLAQQAERAFGKDDVLLTGHSLGAGLASAAAAATGAVAVVFDAQGLGDSTLAWLHVDPPQARQAAAQGQIRSYTLGAHGVPVDYAQGLQVGWLVTSSLFPKPLGSVLMFEHPDNGRVPLADGHWEGFFPGLLDDRAPAGKVDSTPGFAEDPFELLGWAAVYLFTLDQHWKAGQETPGEHDEA